MTTLVPSFVGCVLFILTGNNDNLKSLYEFEFGQDSIGDY